MKGDSLALNFEIALEKIDTLTKQNNELLDTIDRLEIELKEIASELDSKITKPLTVDDLRIERFDALLVLKISVIQLGNGLFEICHMSLAWFRIKFALKLRILKSLNIGWDGESLSLKDMMRITLFWLI